MQKRTRFGGLNFIAVILGAACLVLPARAQMEQGEQLQPEAILRIAIVDLKVQGDQEPPVVREAFTTVLPAMAECMQAEYQRVGKVPSRIIPRFNVGGNGKVVWCKVTEPVAKSLDACLCKLMSQIKFPPTDETRSRVTVELEVRRDHLLAP